MQKQELSWNMKVKARISKDRCDACIYAHIVPYYKIKDMREEQRRADGRN
jgi:hypothetical protein